MIILYEANVQNFDIAVFIILRTFQNFALRDMRLSKGKSEIKPTEICTIILTNKQGLYFK